MINNPQNGFEQIKISKRLKEVVDNTMKRAKKAKKRNLIKLNLIKFSTGIASIFIVFVLGVNYIPVFAQSVSNVPILSAIARAVQINYSNNIGSAINEGFSEDIQQSKMEAILKLILIM